MVSDIPGDLAEKAAIMREFGELRAAGKPVPAELHAKHVNATNHRYTTGPDWTAHPRFHASGPGRCSEVPRDSRRSLRSASRFLS